ncbi:uncharacterized protein LOC121390952 [Gigantopelta aegis]|uniref:uncharacterized protein LOC121390952 n=1 Tax=Gigantopelta aegis TaxID=1735272 RepID=UPI001B8894A5|nr:uncharacterized protein LOC121390952 [Gigantopelta aegis]
MGIVDYECVPESVNYNMCYNLTASSQTNKNVFFLASPKSGTSHPILCNCEIRGKNMRVQIVDFRANMMDNEKWVLNITSGFMLNDSTPSNSPFIRLLNNVLGGYHDTVHIQYYSENTSNQNIWIELTGPTDVQMNLSCTSWIYSGTRNTYQPQTSQTGTPVKPSSTHSTNITETPTANYNTTFTSAFANTTSTVNKSSQTPTSSVSTSAENTTSTEVTTNDSGAYSSGQSSSRGVFVVS